jgi:DNA-binding GntR family transcriptional regulator
METDRVYEQLLKLITTLQLEPGSTVTQAELVELLDCGRTPLREATQRLMVEGLVHHHPNRGISIAPLDIRLFGQANEAYRCVHSQAIRRAAMRRTEAQVAELQALLEEADPLLTDAQPAAAAGLDIQFHSLLAAASQNQYLAEDAARLEKLLSRYIALGRSDGGPHKEVWAYHQKILDAVRDQDPDEAERLFFEHIDLGVHHVLESWGMPDVSLRPWREGGG